MEDHHAEILAAQIMRSDNAKLVTTFAAGVVAAVVLPSLGSDHTDGALALGRALLAGALGLALVVFLLDLVETPDYADLDRRAGAEGWSSEDSAEEAEFARFRTVTWNERVVTWMRWASQAQLLVSALAAGYALLWLR